MSHKFITSFFILNIYSKVFTLFLFNIIFNGINVINFIFLNLKQSLLNNLKQSSTGLGALT